MLKKFLFTFLPLILILSTAIADMNVQLIGGPQADIDPISLDDFRLNTDAEIRGFGMLCGTEFEIADSLGYYLRGMNSMPQTGGPRYYESGNEAEYVLMRMDILNTSSKAQNYLIDCSVKVIYDKEYEYGGWFFQSNFNNKPSTNWLTPDAGIQNLKFVIDPRDNFDIAPMYEGHYVFGCTLPNAIISSREPLTMIITLGDHEITYHIR